MITPVPSQATLHARRSTAVAATNAGGDASAPADVVEVKGAVPAAPARRPIFAEAARLGLMAHGAAIGGPLGQALSAAAQDDLGKLLQEMTAAGLTFAAHGNPEDLFRYGDTPLTPDAVKARILESNGGFEDARLTVSDADKKGMKFAHVKHLSELEGLQALAVEKDASSLPESDPGRTLLALADKGKRFFVNVEEDGSGRRVLDNLGNGTAREVGVYGAWRAMTEPPPAPISIGGGPVTVKVDHSESYRVYVSNVDPEPFSFSMRPTEVPVRIVGEAGLRAAAFFDLNAPDEELDADPLAVSLRGLAQGGVTFHYDSEEKGRTLDRTALGLYHEMRGDVKVGVWGEAQEKVTVEQLSDPATLPATIKDLSKFFVDHVAPKLADGRLQDRDALMWVRAASQPAGNLSMASRADMIEALYADEKAQGTRPEAQALAAARGMIWLSKLLKPAEDPAAAMAEFGSLRRRHLSPDMAGEAMVYFRGTLAKITFDEKDFQTQREQFVQVASLAGCQFKDALEARDLIAYTQPFDSGLALLRHTVETDATLRAPEKPANLDDVSSILDDGPRPFEQGMADYKLVLAHAAPGDTMGTAQALRSLHDVLVPAIGWEGSRQTFVFLQRGSAHQAFGDRTRDEAVGTFLQNYVMSRDLESACRAVLALGKGDAKISTDDVTGEVIVGGIRIPRRRT